MPIVSDLAENIPENKYVKLTKYCHQVIIERLGWAAIAQIVERSRTRLIARTLSYVMAEEYYGNIR